ncbi:DegT/DnrJ/EryC1/StrS family aminotransferase [Rhodobacteraceae bacterium NNCM2]|nr:DegT/DnrJ/EryC1/StrS family aminotransferase [Coraliihabitans acroporae]
MAARDTKGTGTKGLVPVFSNSLGQEELEKVSTVFASGWLGKGRECDGFEAEFAAMLGAPSALLTNCCTSAIYIALRSLGIGAGDEVIVSTINFVACASAVIECGGTPVFADVDPVTLNILPSEIERLKTPRTKAVFLLHYGGHPSDMDAVRAACGERIMILEDSANSVSSSYKGAMCGTLGDAGVFSFDAMKILVMGDGGALTLRDEEAVERAKSLRYLGYPDKTKSGLASLAEKSTSRWWEYEVEVASGRYISNDIMAAIGRVQLQKLDGFIARRREVWEFYQQAFADLGAISRPPEPLAGCTSSYYLYCIQLPKLRDELAAYLAENGVYTTFRYFPLHLVSFYGSTEALPMAEQANERALNLPVHQNLTDDDLEMIVGLVRRFVAERF